MFYAVFEGNLHSTELTGNAVRDGRSTTGTRRGNILLGGGVLVQGARSALAQSLVGQETALSEAGLAEFAR